MRILFKKGKQKAFIEKILSKISVAKASEICNLSERTIRDWRQERFLMEKTAMLKLCKITCVDIPKNIKEKDNYWYINSSAGMMAAIKKHGHIGGDIEIRKIKWKEWWNTKGKYSITNPFFIRRRINCPRKSKDLAEFIGIMLGDGGIALSGSQICITLNSKDDKDYIKFVYKLIKKLFNKNPNILKRKNAMASVIYISSMNLVDYLVRLGLKKGNKVKLQVDIPDWIKNNLEFSKACVRGLIDTDGCIFNHSYKVKNKIYNYKKMVFTSYSRPLRRSVYKILKLVGIKSRFSSYRDVRIDSQKDVRLYFKIIGTSNTKHLKRYVK